MKFPKSFLFISVGLGLALADVRAALFTFSSQAAFDAAAPGTAVQTFAAGTEMGLVGFPGSLNSGTATAGTGPILAGLNLAATNGGNLAIIGPGALANTTRGILSDTFVETLNISFTSGQTAVGLGLMSQASASPFSITVFNTANVLIGTFPVASVPNSGAGTFWGVTASGGDTIGRINLSSATNQAEGVDLIKFGSAGGAVPDAGNTALLAALVLTALATLRRKFGTA